MNIGRAAAVCGVTAKMIRHYEGIGLIPSVRREASNYRSYTREDVRRLRFVRSARDLGFPIERIRALLALWDDEARSSADVKALALQHVGELEDKIARLREMADDLRGLARRCAGDDQPDCAILDRLGTLPRDADGPAGAARAVPSSAVDPGACAWDPERPGAARPARPARRSA